MLLEAGQYKLARDLYQKLLNCAHTNKDVITNMFCYKQLAYTNSKMKKYETAILCFKHLLALAWTCRSPESELAAYDGLQMMYLYQG